jgi:hypothetical protein
LMQTLKRDATIFVGAKTDGDFLPRPALLALLMDEPHEWFKTAAISASAATSFIFGFRVHSSLVYPSRW